jgi:alanine racemase
MRAARADIDLSAIAHNVEVLAAHVAPAEVCAVVKADGYGHGAIAVGQAAIEAGASWLAVALIEEAAVLRKAGVTAPILILSQPRLDDFDAAVHYDLRLTVYSAEGIEAASAAAIAEDKVARLHLKVNTGMNRVGAAPGDILELAKLASGRPELELEALWTHCAVADEPDHPFTTEQLSVFGHVAAELDSAGLRPPMLHAANSAAAIDHPQARFDLVRAGIAVYGVPPSPALADRLDLRPAMRLSAEVSMVKRVAAGERVSYGLRHEFTEATTVVTVPIGYADGVPRRLSSVGGEVLIGGRRVPIVGVVTMDQLMVDVGDLEVEVGDEVVLIGSQVTDAGDGVETIVADDWAARLDTIGYEVVCGIGPRVPRFYRQRPKQS